MTASAYWISGPSKGHLRFVIGGAVRASPGLRSRSTDRRGPRGPSGFRRSLPRTANDRRGGPVWGSVVLLRAVVLTRPGRTGVVLGGALPGAGGTPPGAD
ncbi:hypothetical protein KTU01_08790 [Kocuria turfanensis]|uniref:Uncharacterized protein n=1 Tax=Kocuria turfanensis TaxID=388357 RepID=A0A512IAM6_9MICC|nr:hypothetical protein KTU01_08790 [Kocuria turfanensis]